MPTHSYIMYMHERDIMIVSVAKLETLLLPTVQECEVELYEIEFVKERGEYILRLFIDKENGADLNDCERVSRAISTALDEHDPIEAAYRLQVGTPGIDRRLTRPWHFKRYIGCRVELKLFAPHSPVDGRKKFTGTLKSYENDIIVLTDDDGQTWNFEQKQVSVCRLVPEL